MATVFGLSGLKSRLDDWRANRKNSETKSLTLVDPTITNFGIVDWNGKDQNLSLLLENLVIPRLLADRDNASRWLESAARTQSSQGIRPQSINDSSIDEFTQLSLQAETHALLDFVDQCLKAGCSVEAIFVHLLAPAARKLGEYWETDNADFVAVTMGLWRIQETLRELTLRTPPKTSPGHGLRSALFSPLPGDQHSFGTLMLSECFQRAGWETDVLIEPAPSELTAKFARRHYDLIGLTISCDCPTGSLASLVKTIKAVSVNPHVRIMIGGHAVNLQPSLVADCGADATAIDACAAVELADHLVPERVDNFERLR